MYAIYASKAVVEVLGFYESFKGEASAVIATAEGKIIPARLAQIHLLPENSKVIADMDLKMFPKEVPVKEIVEKLAETKVVSGKKPKTDDDEFQPK